jgi:hypothetical protein
MKSHIVALSCLFGLAAVSFAGADPCVPKITKNTAYCVSCDSADTSKECVQKAKADLKKRFGGCDSLNEGIVQAPEGVTPEVSDRSVTCTKVSTKSAPQGEAKKSIQTE